MNTPAPVFRYTCAWVSSLGCTPRNGIVVDRFPYFFPLCWKILYKEVGVCMCVIIPESSNLTVYIPFGSTFLKISSTGFFLSLSFSEAHKSLWCSFHCNFLLSFCYILLNVFSTSFNCEHKSIVILLLDYDY